MGDNMELFRLYCPEMGTYVSTWCSSREEVRDELEILEGIQGDLLTMKIHKFNAYVVEEESTR